jgi:CelD/BcsL family acetyltransferase involved in cellulose biosynthesis
LNVVEMGMSPASFVEGKGEPVTFFRIRVAHDLAEFADLWPRTDRCGLAHCYVFQCADILQVWCDTIGRAWRTRAIFVAVFDDIGRPMLLIPLCIERRRGIRMLRFIDGGLSDYNAPILFEPTRTWGRETLERLWRELIEVLPPFDIAMFDKMPADICGVPNPLVSLRGTPSAEAAHSTSITSGWKEYAAKHLPHKNNSRYQRRRLAQLGLLAFKVAETPADRQRILRAAMRQKSRRFIETTGVNYLDRPGYRQYYTTMTERFAWPGPLLIAALELDGKILSAGWHFIFNRRFVFFLTSYEGDEWKRFSPGRLLLEDLLEWSFSNGITVFDFTFGDENYKLEYSNKKLLLYQANIPVTTVGQVYQVGRNTKAWKLLRPVVKRGINKFLSSAFKSDAPE